MTNRLRSLISDHLLAPLDAVYRRIDADQLDNDSRLARASVPRSVNRAAVRAAPLRHLIR